jgi:hypothetical protein
MLGAADSHESAFFVLQMLNEKSGWRITYFRYDKGSKKGGTVLPKDLMGLMLGVTFLHTPAQAIHPP